MIVFIIGVSILIVSTSIISMVVFKIFKEIVE